MKTQPKINKYFLNKIKVCGRGETAQGNKRGPKEKRLNSQS